MRAEAILASVRDALRAAQRSRGGGAFAAMCASALAATIAISLLVARVGTPKTRAGAIALVFGCALSVTIFAVARLVHWRNAKAAIRTEVRESDEALAGAIDRAVTLLERSEVEAQGATDDVAARDAQALSELHLSRQLGRISFARIADKAARHALVLGTIASLVAAGVLVAIILEPIRLVEGADVLAARRGVAPLALVYLDDVDLVSTPPAYLQQPERDLEDFGSTKAPRGSVITLRGKAVRPGRSLVITDGEKEVPFEADGSGTVVAKWTLGESATLRVAARFGKVLIPQGDKLSVQAIPDDPPVVKLEGAPKTVRLIDTPSVALEYEATDDHGLREIQLVLRSGKEVERRTLARPSADTKTARGGEEVSTSEPFFKKSFLPVEVTVEARDNDGVLGPKWGRSAAIVVVPPAIGEPEARRYAALVQIRDALVDLTAARVTHDHDIKDGAAVAKDEADKERAASVVIEDILSESHGGLLIRGRVRTVIAGQLRRLDHAVTALRDKPTADEYAKLVGASEDAVLAVDSAIRAQGLRDAATVSQKLSFVAISIAETAHGYDREPDRATADQGLDATIGVLAGGGKELATLGELGFDLGDVTRGGVGRIKRSRSAGDMVHTEIAARDLADRLSRADASLGGGGRAGVESGGVPSGSSSADEGDASEAESDAEQTGREVDQLLKHHGDEIAKVAEAMKNATTPEERDALKKLAKEQADAIREAVKDLPDKGTADSPAGRAAEGKKHAQAMASSLEEGDIDEAVKRGSEALEALRDAAQLGKDSPFGDDQDLGNDATRGGNRIDEALEALKNLRDKMRDSAKERAKDDLSTAGEDEKRLGERARDVRERSEKGSAPMPQDKLDKLQEAERAMREASKALKEGDGERGRASQQEAQRFLEMAKSDDDEDGEGKGPKGEAADNGKHMSQDTKVPDKDKPRAPEDFQKRVTDGLGMPQDPRLREAIKRYAEGLLR